ncbi:MAG: hypothetical protein Q7U36_04205 [bacterium]|nr:hypothetical protein [bacterium]
MTKVTKPNKEFWGTEKQPAFLKISPNVNEVNEGAYKVSLRKDKNQKKEKTKKE